MQDRQGTAVLRPSISRKQQWKFEMNWQLTIDKTCRLSGLLALLWLAACASQPRYEDPINNPELAPAIARCDELYKSNELQWSTPQLSAMSGCDRQAIQDYQDRKSAEHKAQLEAKLAPQAHADAQRIIAAAEMDKAHHNPFPTGIEYYWGEEGEEKATLARMTAHEVAMRFPVSGPQFLDGKDQFVIVWGPDQP